MDGAYPDGRRAEKAIEIPNIEDAVAESENSAQLVEENTSKNPLDGGFWAWASTVGGHLALMNTWGLNSSFGVFQTYYMQELDRSPDDISWIGSLQIFFLFFIGTFAGRLTDAGHFRVVFVVGSCLTCLGIFMASVSGTYWQILLSQGICTGIGNGLLFTPALAIVGTYFRERRSLAYGVTATGTATGGLIFPTMARQLLPHYWQIVACDQGLPPKPKAPFVDWTAFKDLSYTFFACGMFSAFWGMYFAYYYVTTFATTQLNPPMDYLNSLDLLLVINGVGYVGRMVPNFFADRFLGPITLMIPFTLVSGICLVAWIPVTSASGLYVWTIVYGIGAGGIQSLFPASLTRLTADVHKTGIRMGMVCTTNSFATLTGPPIAGAILKATGPRYVGAQAFAGASLVLATGFFIAARSVAIRDRGLSWMSNI